MSLLLFSNGNIFENIFQKECKHWTELEICKQIPRQQCINTGGFPFFQYSIKMLNRAIFYRRMETQHMYVWTWMCTTLNEGTETSLRAVDLIFRSVVLLSWYSSICRILNKGILNVLTELFIARNNNIHLAFIQHPYNGLQKLIE